MMVKVLLMLSTVSQQQSSHWSVQLSVMWQELLFKTTCMAMRCRRCRGKVMCRWPLWHNCVHFFCTVKLLPSLSAHRIRCHGDFREGSGLFFPLWCLTESDCLKSIISALMFVFIWKFYCMECLCFYVFFILLGYSIILTWCFCILNIWEIVAYIVFKIYQTEAPLNF